MYTLTVVLLLITTSTSFKLFDSKIIGGEIAEKNQFPYVVSIWTHDENGNEGFICGGSIIGSRWILTAAHCFMYEEASNLFVIAGSSKLNQSAKRYEVSKFIQHDSFNKFTLMNDISLVKLSEDLIFNENISSIKIDENDVGIDETATLIGWGSTTHPGPFSDDLRFMEVRTFPTEKCKELMVSSYVWDSQICTFTKEGEGSCHGDSGGPLVRDGKLIGIVSWGEPCALGYPDVFTRVYSFIPWVNEMIESNCN